MKHIKRHETCKCKCRLYASICNNKQSWNDDKRRCESKELIDKGVCNKGYIWNRSNLVIASVNVINHAILGSI